MFKRKIISTFLFFTLLVFPSFSLAQETTSVASFMTTCGAAGEGDNSRECGYEDLIKLITKVLDFILKVLIPLIVVFVMLRAGFKLMTSRDKPNALQEAKASIWSLLTGLFFMLCAWVIVFEITKLLDVNYSNSNQPETGVVKLLGE
jgi:uncharacterized membrane protein (GlpM family)